MTNQEKTLQEKSKNDILSQFDVSLEDYEAYYRQRYGWSIRKKITENKEELQAV